MKVTAKEWAGSIILKLTSLLYLAPSLTKNYPTCKPLEILQVKSTSYTYSLVIALKME